jgi:hypothetical protein
MTVYTRHQTPPTPADPPGPAGLWMPWYTGLGEVCIPCQAEPGPLGCNPYCTGAYSVNNLILPSIPPSSYCSSSSIPTTIPLTIQSTAPCLWRYMAPTANGLLLCSKSGDGWNQDGYFAVYMTMEGPIGNWRVRVVISTHWVRRETGYDDYSWNLFYYSRYSTSNSCLDPFDGSTMTITYDHQTIFGGITPPVDFSSPWSELDVVLNTP